MAKRSASPEREFPHDDGEETNPRDAKIHPRTIIPSIPSAFASAFDDSYQSLADKQRHIENLFEEHTWMLKSILDNVGNMQSATLMDNVIRRLVNSKKLVNEARELTGKKTLPYTTSRAPKLPKSS
jgi:hypothetical protein